MALLRRRESSGSEAAVFGPDGYRCPSPPGTSGAAFGAARRRGEASGRDGRVCWADWYPSRRSAKRAARRPKLPAGLASNARRSLKEIGSRAHPAKPRPPGQPTPQSARRAHSESPRDAGRPAPLAGAAGAKADEGRSRGRGRGGLLRGLGPGVRCGAEAGLGRTRTGPGIATGGGTGARGTRTRRRGGGGRRGRACVRLVGVGPSEPDLEGGSVAGLRATGGLWAKGHEVRGSAPYRVPAPARELGAGDRRLAPCGATRSPRVRACQPPAKNAARRRAGRASRVCVIE